MLIFVLCLSLCNACLRVVFTFVLPLCYLVFCAWLIGTFNVVWLCCVGLWGYADPTPVV